MSNQKYYTATIPLPNGQRKWIRAKTKEGVEKKKKQLMVSIGQGINVLDHTTVKDFAELWYETYKEPYLRPKSLEAINNALKNHILPAIGNVQVKDITPLHVQRILLSLSDRSKTLNAQVLQVLRGIFNTAVDNGIILKTPITTNTKVGGTKTKEKTALTREQSEQLLTSIAGTRAYLFCLIALQTGMRRGEILGLRWADVDIDNGLIRVSNNAVLTNTSVVVSENTKTDAARRTLPIPPALQSVPMEEKRKSTSVYVVPAQNGSVMNRSSFVKMMEIIQTRTAPRPELLGQPVDLWHPNVKYGIDFKVTAHQLRHTYITRLFESGLDLKEVQYLAGHATPTMTLKVYTHYIQESRFSYTAEKVKAALE